MFTLDHHFGPDLEDWSSSKDSSRIRENINYFVIVIVY